MVWPLARMRTVTWADRDRVKCTPCCVNLGATVKSEKRSAPNRTGAGVAVRRGVGVGWGVGAAMAVGVAVAWAVGVGTKVLIGGMGGILVVAAVATVIAACPCCGGRGLAEAESNAGSHGQYRSLG